MKLSEALAVPAALPDGVRFLYYWLSPEAKLIDIDHHHDNGIRYHVSYVLNHPEEFGLPESYPKEILAKFAEHYKKKNPTFDDLVDTEYSDEVLTKVYDNHWIRLSFDYTDWSAFLGKMDHKNAITLEMFCRNLIGNKYHLPEFFTSSRLDMVIFPLYSDDITLEVGQIAKGYLEDNIR